MALYLIGDVQGCNASLGALLEKIAFSPSRDTLYLLGDMVNRGPDSLGVLRRLMTLGDCARCVLGNHDLSLLVIASGGRIPRAQDTIGDVLNAPDRETLLHWLRHQPLCRYEHGVLMVHAGVLPSWTLAQTLDLAGEVDAGLQGSEHSAFLSQIYGNEPARWQDELTGVARLRVIVNALTRLRLVDAQGAMDLHSTGGPAFAPVGYTPWFDAPGRLTANTPIAFGHWSSLGLLLRPDVIGLDTGCAWGGHLSALRFDSGAGLSASADALQRELIQVTCSSA